MSPWQVASVLRQADVNEGVVIVLTKDRESRGGVANYFRLLFDVYCTPGTRLEWFTIGSRARDYHRRRGRLVGYIAQHVADMGRLCVALSLRPEISIVQVNPSLIPVPLLRDGMALLCARAHRRKTVAFFRGWTEFSTTIRDSAVLRRTFLATYGAVDRVIVLAHSFARELEAIGIPAERITVSRTVFDGEGVPCRRQPRTGPLSFVFLGRLSDAKGMVELLDAAARLVRQGYRFRLDVVGHGSADDAIARYSRRAGELGLTAVCRFHGYLEGAAKAEVLAGGDVFVLPSHHEGCPNAVLEAMAAGMYVVATNVGALPEVVPNEEHGILVEPRSSDAFGEAMSWCLEHVDDTRGRGLANGPYSRDNFEVRVIARQLGELYLDLAGMGGVSSGLDSTGIEARQ